MTKEEILEAIKAMTVVELNDLVKTLQDEFGVSGAPMMMAGPMTTGAAGGAEDAGEAVKNTFDIVLTAPGDKKIQVIKVIKDITGLGLKEAKTLADTPNAKIKENVAPDEAEALKKQLEEAGGTVELK